MFVQTRAFVAAVNVSMESSESKEPPKPTESSHGPARPGRTSASVLLGLREREASGGRRREPLDVAKMQQKHRERNMEASQAEEIRKAEAEAQAKAEARTRAESKERRAESKERKKARRAARTVSKLEEKRKARERTGQKRAFQVPQTEAERMREAIAQKAAVAAREAAEEAAPPPSTWRRKRRRLKVVEPQPPPPTKQRLSNRSSTMDLIGLAAQLERESESSHLLRGTNWHLGRDCESRLRIWLEPILLSTRFNVAIGVLIGINAAILGFELDSHENAKAGAAVMWFVKYPDVPGWVFDAFEIFFATIFSIEIAMRFYVWRLKLFRDFWFLLDVICCLPPVVIICAQASDDLVDSFLVVRLIRLLKLSRLLRFFKLFNELYLLAASFVMALRSLFWVMLLLFMAVYMAGVWCTILVGQNHHFSAKDARVMQYFETYGEMLERERFFGSISRSMTTLFQILTLDDWMQIVRPIIETHQPGMLYFFVLFIFVTTFGILNLLVGVLVEHQVTVSKAHAASKARLLDQETQEIATVALLLFDQVDIDGIGTLRSDELADYIYDLRYGQGFDSLAGLLPAGSGIDINEVLEVCDMVAQGWFWGEASSHIEIGVEEFVGATIRFHGDTRSKDMVAASFATSRAAKQAAKLECDVEELQKETAGIRTTQAQAAMMLDEVLKEFGMMYRPEQDERPSGWQLLRSMHKAKTLLPSLAAVEEHWREEWFARKEASCGFSLDRSPFKARGCIAMDILGRASANGPSLLSSRNVFYGQLSSLDLDKGAAGPDVPAATETIPPEYSEQPKPEAIEDDETDEHPAAFPSPRSQQSAFVHQVLQYHSMEEPTSRPTSPRQWCGAATSRRCSSFCDPD